MVRGAPTRGSSYKPSSRRSMKRVRHLPTVALEVRCRRATVVFGTASVHASTRRARNARARLTWARFVKRTNSRRSTSVTTNATLGRPIVAISSLDHNMAICIRQFVSRGLAVQSRHVVERVQSESFRLLCPELTNALKRGEPTETLETLGKVVRIEERGHMRA